jgi:chromatin modification-related protein VID21
MTLEALFHGPRKPRDYPTTHPPSQPRDARERQSTLIWTPEEDAHLKHLAYLYSLNWKLVSDAFATWRIGINTDKRTEWDCFERWNRLWGPSGIASRQLQQAQLQQQLAEQQAQNEAQSGDADSIGQRRQARSTQSVFKKPPPPPLQLQLPPSNPMNMSTKKQIRRTFLFEAIKKSAKKRDATLMKGEFLV